MYHLARPVRPVDPVYDKYLHTVGLDLVHALCADDGNLVQQLELSTMPGTSSGVSFERMLLK